MIFSLDFGNQGKDYSPKNYSKGKCQAAKASATGCLLQSKTYSSAQFKLEGAIGGLHHSQLAQGVTLSA